MEKLSLTQNIYIILTLAENEEVIKKKTLFLHESVKKAAKAEPVREIISMQFFC